MTAGEHLKAIRLKKEMTLRGFCLLAEVDSGNYSRLERGLLPLPKDSCVRERVRKALGLGPDAPEWREVERLASIERGEIPSRILSDQEVAAKLPALFRNLEGDSDGDRLDELIELVRREHTPALNTEQDPVFELRRNRK